MQFHPIHIHLDTTTIPTKISLSCSHLYALPSQIRTHIQIRVLSRIFFCLCCQIQCLSLPASSSIIEYVLSRKIPALEWPTPLPSVQNRDLDLFFSQKEILKSELIITIFLWSRIIDLIAYSIISYHDRFTKKKETYVTKDSE